MNKPTANVLQKSSGCERDGLIIALGAAVRADGGASPAMRRRVVSAVGQAWQCPQALVLVSGGYGRRHPKQAPTEAQVMAALACDLGLPHDRLIVEDRSRNTLENALYSLGMAEDLGVRTVWVVTDAPHLPRALLTFRAVARARGLTVGIEGVAAPGPQDLLPRRLAMVREAVARLFYRWRLAWGAAADASGRCPRS